MGLVLNRIAIENFRKFRDRQEITGLTDGLNVIVEPNETGKSTLMEAVRAALFLRHGSKTQLIKSFQPYGDAVAPQVELDFTIDGAPYRLVKRFLSRPVAELEGPDGRQHGDAAEEALQSLLGFEKQSSGLDSTSLGTLGLLWVPQTEGLDLVPPGDKVREGIGGALEGQADALLGSAMFDRVRDRIEAEYTRFRTARAGSSTGELKQAEARLEEAEAALKEAQQRESALEAAYAELEQARGQLALVAGELADPGDMEQREKLAGDLELARGAAQRLETEQARHAGAAARVEKLEDLHRRHDQARRLVTESEAELKRRKADHAILADGLANARRKAAETGAALDECRRARNEARKALDAAQKQEARRRERADIERARQRHAGLLKLEEQRAQFARIARTAVPASAFTDLERIEAAIDQERAVLQAGGVRIAFSGSANVTLDGENLAEGETTLTREARIALADGSEIRIHPPANLAGAEYRLEDARARHAALLEELQAGSLAELRSRDRAARDAAVELQGIGKQIEALTAADETLGIAAGAEALKLFIAELPEGADPAEEDGGKTPPLPELQQALEESETALARAEEFNQSALDELRTAEKDEMAGSVRTSQAEGEFARGQRDLAEIEALAEFATLADDLPEARADLARKAAALEEARRNAAALDADAIRRRMEMLDRRREGAARRKAELDQEIARLETRIETEGGRGLAERTATARDEQAAAAAALARMTDEAETLALLRDVLGEAREEVSRSMVGPVAERARRYTQRILPGCDPIFGSDLGMAAIRRASGEEDCNLLSQGTQEQLAVLSRLAFAELLREEGRPVSLMLDDPLVYSDDVRLDAMIDLLEEASRDMQIIVLTCRERAFRAAPGKRLRLLDAV
ncbi:hypothetical protein FHS61_002953 [Altererythrobacter atlanticus]|uniref:Chromosome segregation protein n=1 Tax=Croceibacterium atlanticum TaxID=1267766 RepID=A0A0F7KYI8_9SPHN|nr:ATP-binding protein [Croceibacterium atlanticum]AKH44311.1 chromosome segregation protein [Croceibacterium atlanticum]MBB5733906.1 hypothetical protein [Croceibacterium atlanticum]